MRKALILLCALLFSVSALAQGGFEADTIVVKTKNRPINDYSMIGVEVGPTFSRMSFNPKVKQGWLMSPLYVGVNYIKDLKMFGYLPYFGYEIGIGYGHSGYNFTENKENGYIHTIEGATSARFDYVEVPFKLHGHVDMEHFALMASAGIYGAYRLGIHRYGDNVTPGLENSFAPYDLRWDYGVSASVGFAVIFEPIEIHVKVGGHVWSWGSIYTPDSSPSQYSKYYYRFAYPMDLNLTVGVYYQLSKRRGRTSADLRREAYNRVYHPEDINAE